MNEESVSKNVKMQTVSKINYQNPEGGEYTPDEKGRVTKFGNVVKTEENILNN